MDVCLINTSKVNLGTRYISSVLKEKGYEVGLAFFESKESEYSEEALKEITKWVKDMDPDVLGVSSIECSRVKSMQILRRLSNMESIFLVAGGIDPTLNPQQYEGLCNVVFRGEGEEFFCEIVEKVRKGEDYRNLPNISYKEKDNTFRNPIESCISELDKLPLPDYFGSKYFNLVDREVKEVEESETHKFLDSNEYMIRSGRGCPHNCSFCSNHLLREKFPSRKSYTRKMDPESIVRRTRELSERVNVEHIILSEEDFTFRNESEIEKFAKLWKEEVDLPFSTEFSAHTLSEGKIESLADAGLVNGAMGVQSGSNFINKQIFNRPVSIEEIFNATEILSKYCKSSENQMNPPRLDVIINNPFSKFEDLKKTLRLLKELPKPYFLRVFNLVFFEGSEIYKKAVKEGHIDKGIDKYDFGDFRTLKRGDSEKALINLLIYLMNGLNTKKRYGKLPRPFLYFLIHPKIMNIIKGHKDLVELCSRALISLKRWKNR